MADAKTKGLSDITLVIVAFVVVFLYFSSAFMYIDSNQINYAQNACKRHGGLHKYYLHFSSYKFECMDGTQYHISNPKKNFKKLLKSFAQ